MEPVGHLRRLGCGLAHRLGERTTPVPGDDLDVLGPMVLEPYRHSSGIAVGQYVHHAMLLQIDHDSSVSDSAAEREIVDSEYPR